MKTLKAAIKMHLITTMWMFAWALQFSAPEKSGHIIINIVAYFKQEPLFKSVSLSVRITTWFSVIKQLSSVELTSD